MAQIQSPETYADGQQVTASRLNNQTNGAILLPGAITDQTAIAAGTVAVGDQVILHDASASAIRKATIGDILGSGINASLGSASIDTLTTSVINGNANGDINATPNDGTLVTGKTFSSIDGITAVVSSTAHGLENNTVLNITASNSAYSGQYFINVISVDSFSYTIRQDTPVTASGTIDYTKKGTVKIAGSEHISGNLEVVGKAELKGALAVGGNLLSTGNSTFSGTSNFTGNLQVNGSTAYVLYDVTTENIPFWSAPSIGFHNGAFTSSSFTKPADEIWVLEVNMSFLGNGNPFEYAIRYGSQTYQTGQYLGFYRHKDAGGEGVLLLKCANHNFLIPAGTAVTSETIKIDAHTASSSSGMQLFTTASLTGTAFTSATLASSTFRIFKYKTA